LKNAFKNNIIIVPSWGSSWKYGNYKYLCEVYDDIKSQFSIKINQPVLMAISGGGGTAFSFYNKEPERFNSLISLATCPYITTVRRMKNNLSIIMICGKNDKRFPWTYIKRLVRSMKATVKDFKVKLLAADHFFFLSHQKEWIEFVKNNTTLK
jgi:dienelactone hydrolase